MAALSGIEVEWESDGVSGRFSMTIRVPPSLVPHLRSPSDLLYTFMSAVMRNGIDLIGTDRLTTRYQSSGMTLVWDATFRRPMEGSDPDRVFQLLEATKNQIEAKTGMDWVDEWR